jgi:iron complex outermembrane receptor protein
VLLGRVTDSLTARPLPGARIEVLRRDSATAARGLTGNGGGFRISGIPAGTYTVRVALIGYQPRRVAELHIPPDTEATLFVALKPLGTTLNPVVVSVSRAPEKALDAPATISVVDTRTIEEQPTLTPVDHVRDAPGVDMATTGVIQSRIVTRGFNSVFSGALLVLTDNRYDYVPSLRVNAPSLIPTSNDDIEHMEVVLGPAAALYGPNAAQGVLQIVTRSPFEWTGTTLSVGGISRAANPTGSAGGLLQTALRHAGTIGSTFGYKLSAQLLSGTDWPERDSAELGASRDALANGANDSTRRIARRDFAVRRWTAEAQADYRPNENTDVAFALGRTDAGNAIELTGVGAAQVRSWHYDYYQARLHHDRLFAQAFVNLSDAGDTYLLRTGAHVVDRSRMFVAQLQDAADWGARQSLIYGLDLQRTEPRSPTTFGRNEGRADIDEIGGYLHSVTHLSPRVDLVAAARVDKHNRLPAATFSPRAALVFKASDSHTFRFTFNHAFDTPGTDNLFYDIVGKTLDPLPYIVRLLGVPASGMYFRHDCAGGLCMRSPFYVPPYVSSPAQPLPIDATLLWQTVVNLVRQGGGPDLSRIPAPTAGDVGSVLRVLDVPSQTFNNIAPTDVRDIPPLRPTVTNTLEAGYKGVIGQRIRLDLDLYYERKKDFIGTPVVETPNVFLLGGQVGDPHSLATYLARYMSPAQAQQLATVIGGMSGSTAYRGIPLGTVSPESWLTGNPDVILTYRNFGALDRWGSDVGVELSLTNFLSLSAAYSWTNKDLFPRTEVGGFSDIALNAPRNKASLSLQYRNADQDVSAYARGRYVAAFPMRSGVYTGTVQSYRIADAGLAYRLPQLPGILFTLGAQNLFNKQHREFLGAPVIGRLLTAQAQYTFQ